VFRFYEADARDLRLPAAMLLAVCAWLNGGADEGAGSAERTVRITANNAGADTCSEAP
jgi:hypothetical protein